MKIEEDLITIVKRIAALLFNFVSNINKQQYEVHYCWTKWALSLHDDQLVRRRSINTTKNHHYAEQRRLTSMKMQWNPIKMQQFQWNRASGPIALTYIDLYATGVNGPMGYGGLYFKIPSILFSCPEQLNR